MRLKSFLYQSFASLVLIVACIWVYDTHLKKDVVLIQSDAPVPVRVSYPTNYEFRQSLLMGGLSSLSFIESARVAKSSVVYIMAYSRVKGGSLYAKDYRREKGSGVISSSDGYIVTNYHVIQKADYISITLEDKREFEAQIVGYDEMSDIALLKIESENLPYMLFANSDSLQVGEWVLAVGNPFGLQSTVTAGIISAKGRNIDAINKDAIESLIQTDAVINPGSSGGALVNLNGLLVGICTAILSSSGNYEGLSFALPSNLVQKVIIDLREFGAVQRGRLGLQVQEINAGIAKENNLDRIMGVQIKSLNLNSPAAKAGLQKNDILIEINGVELNSTSDFYEQINKYRPGDEIRLTYHRKKIKNIVPITLTNYLNTTEFITIRNDKILRDLGIEVRDLNEIEKKRIQVDGVVVVSVSRESIVDKTNMEPGFIIERMNGQSIKDAADLIVKLKSAENEVILEGFYERYAGQFPYAFNMPSDK